MALFRVLSPNLCFTIDDQISQDDKVATRWTTRIQNRGDWSAAGQPGEDIEVTGMSMHSFANGRVMESWDNWDAMTAFQNLGQDIFQSLSLHV